ncbi:MAG TPA: hydantoinase B/oxoprolinase family protein [Candidatus Limnocylindrales bacterium]|nr:hydantoinase B/oxoprolinase family protein [Candidatus Limnocylindrales bacterium]
MRGRSGNARGATQQGHALSAVDLELFANRLIGVTDEMGVVLQSAGLSPNIKERRDFSCALFDAGGEMVAHAAHIPVHLGSTPLAVRAALDHASMAPGDIVILNDPYAGGTHLPDVTLVAPVYLPGGDRPFAYVADRAHHADIGGGSPGSMALATDVHQEGFRMPPVHLCRGDRYVGDTLSLFLANTRVPDERLGDLDAQVAALRAGAARTLDLARRFGPDVLTRAMHELQRYSQRLIEALIAELPRGRFRAVDHLDDDGAGSRDIAIRVELERRARGLHFDFTGSSPQVRGPVNANLAVTTSAVFYAIACVAGRRVPANSGMMAPVTISAREGSVVHCRFPAAVAGGNVETSQRIVDVVLQAFALALPDRVPASSCGTMSNLAMGGFDSVRRRHFSYYETVGGGAGAGPSRNGAHALQTHMTNTWNTPVEALEAYYPLRVTRYSVRRGSGGPGLHTGGEGIVREVEALTEMRVTLLAERRRRRPPGLAGGGGGAPGRDAVIRAGDSRQREIEAKSELTLGAGDRVIIETPGGGGWGAGRGRKKKGRETLRKVSRPSAPGGE